ncbi:hypothetical protein EC036_29500 [Enterobacter cloacae]|jgi:hypothetical protein|nr:hypothetical protein [Enterobacter cloacae]AIV30597.1 hypothetical protein EC036_29500 [Enterobacter cloacae]
MNKLFLGLMPVIFLFEQLHAESQIDPAYLIAQDNYSAKVINNQ